jgi:hypothetical protein
MAESNGPEYAGHRLTRRGMEQVLAEGGSVLHNGHVIQHAAHLPNESELAKGNPDRASAVRAALERQIASLTAQMSDLDPDVVVGPSAGETGQQVNYAHENTVYGEPAGDQAGMRDQAKVAELQATNADPHEPQPQGAHEPQPADPVDESHPADPPEENSRKASKRSEG